MILTVCLNAAIDVTYSVGRVELGSSHTVDVVQSRSGGKAVNTARVLAQLGEPVTLCGFAGGRRGEQLHAGLAQSGVVEALTEIAGETRQSIAVYSADEVTVFNERGPTITEGEWQTLIETISTRLREASAVVISGSVPPGTPDDGYAQLVRLAHAAQVPAVLDAAGTQLMIGLAAAPEIVAPNRSEAAAALGLTPRDDSDPVVEAIELSRLSRGVAVVSDGPRGIVAAADGKRWRAAPPRVVSGNPTGAGDALNAGLALGLARGWELPRTLDQSLALATAAVLSPVAGEIDRAAFHDLTGRASVMEN